MNKKTILIIVFSLFLFASVSAQSLEVDYPGFSPSNTENILPEYVKYIFFLIVAGAGLRAFFGLADYMQ